MKLGLIDLGWPVGKHKHKMMEDIPTDYFLWVVYESDMPKDLMRRAADELDRRGQNKDPYDYDVDDNDEIFDIW